METTYVTKSIYLLFYLIAFGSVVHAQSPSKRSDQERLEKRNYKHAEPKEKDNTLEPRFRKDRPSNPGHYNRRDSKNDFRLRYRHDLHRWNRGGQSFRNQFQYRNHSRPGQNLRSFQQGKRLRSQIWKDGVMTKRERMLQNRFRMQKWNQMRNGRENGRSGMRPKGRSRNI